MSSNDEEFAPTCVCKCKLLQNQCKSTQVHGSWQPNKAQVERKLQTCADRHEFQNLFGQELARESLQANCHLSLTRHSLLHFSILSRSLHITSFSTQIEAVCSLLNFWKILCEMYLQQDEWQYICIKNAHCCCIVGLKKGKTKCK